MVSKGKKENQGNLVSLNSFSRNVVEETVCKN